MTRQHFRQMGPRGVQWMGPILVALLVAGGGWWTLTAVADLQDTAAEGQLARELLAQDVDALRDQVLELGEEPVAPPPSDPPVIPDEPDVVVLRGPQGIRGERGESCIEAIGLGACRGDEGPPGVPGADSTVPGPVGASCVEELGLEACRGDPGLDGRDGRDGEDGADGRGIVSVTCNADNNWEIVFTDDTTQITEGPCRFPPGAGTEEL